jgi:hypothetical protein
MENLTAAQHRRRQIIFGIVLTILIPIVNQFLNRWGLPSLPPFVAPEHATTSSSGVSFVDPDVTPAARFFLDPGTGSNLVQCSVLGCFARDRDPRPQLQSRRPLRFHRREIRRSPPSKSNPTVPVGTRPSIPYEEVC